MIARITPPLLIVFVIALLAALYASAATSARGQDDSEFRTSIVLTDHAYPGPVTSTPIVFDPYPIATATQIPTDTPEPSATPTQTPSPTATNTPTQTPAFEIFLAMLQR